MPSVLIIDDEANIRRMVGALLRAEGYDVREAASGAEGITAVMDDEPDVALLDLMMPGELDGLATLARIRERSADLPVIMMSGRASLGDAVRATKLGAVNFLEKPLAPETMMFALNSALELGQSRRTTRALREELGLTGQMVGSSAALAHVRETITRVAPSEARVLISGESGTGKELVAAAIHHLSPRRDRPFVRVNCAAIPRDLVESEMFGHEKGSFTGATEKRIGRFELAHTGTLFLDEVGDLSIDAQAKLLRAIEAHEIQRVGGNRTIHVDVRIIAATNHDLARAVADGTFREDLYFRLNVIPIQLPPLRERGEDVVELANHFAAVQHRRTGRPALQWSDDALALLRAYPWPGNVRELANIVERIAILNTGTLVRASDVRTVLPAPASNTTPAIPLGAPQGLTEALDETERMLITDALAHTDGNVAEAARRLHTDRPNLYRRMKRLGISGAALVLAGSLLLPSQASAQRDHPPPRDSVRRDTTIARDSTTHDSMTVEFTEPPPRAHFGFALSSGKTYNRVEGLPIILGPTWTFEGTKLAIHTGAFGIIRTGRDWRLHEPDAGHDAHVDIRFGPAQQWGVSGRVYEVVAPTQRWQISEPEASLATFLLHRDYLDFYRRHGGEVTGRWGMAEDQLVLSVSYAAEHWFNMPAADPVTVFRNEQHWRPNPVMDQGVVHLTTFNAIYDTRNNTYAPSVGWYLRGEYELGALATSSQYGRAFFDLRRYNRISPRTELNGRLVLGGWVNGDPLPLERQLSLGGPGTLPGYDFRTPVRGPDVMQCTTPGQALMLAPAECDRVALAQVELRTELASSPFGLFNNRALRFRSAGFTARPMGVLFVDVGRGWRTTTAWPSRYKSDVGAGVDLGLLGLYVAKATSDWRHEPANFFVRIRRRF